MRIAYLLTFPLLIIGIILFFVVTEISKAIERNMGKLGAFYDLQREKDPAVVFSILNQSLMENQSFLDLNWTSAQVDVQFCRQIAEKMINEALQNKEEGFFADSSIYEKARCAE